MSDPNPNPTYQELSDFLGRVTRVEALEALVDRSTIERVLGSLSVVCHAKAEHLRSNWQDERGARAWERAGRAVERARTSDGVRDLS